MGRLGWGRTGKQARRRKKKHKHEQTKHKARQAAQGSKVGQDRSSSIANPSRISPRARLPTSGFQLGWFRLPRPPTFFLLLLLPSGTTRLRSFRVFGCRAWSSFSPLSAWRFSGSSDWSRCHLLMNHPAPSSTYMYHSSGS